MVMAMGMVGRGMAIMVFAITEIAAAAAIIIIVVLMAVVLMAVAALEVEGVDGVVALEVEDVGEEQEWGWKRVMRTCRISRLFLFES